MLKPEQSRKNRFHRFGLFMRLMVKTSKLSGKLLYYVLFLINEAML